MGAVSRNGDNVVASTYNPDNASITTMTGTIDPAGNVIPAGCCCYGERVLGRNGGRIVLDTPPTATAMKLTQPTILA